MLLASKSLFGFGRTKSCNVIDKRVMSDYRRAVECWRADLRDDCKIDRFTISTLTGILTLRDRPPTLRGFFFTAGAVLQKYLTRHIIVLRLGTIYRRVSGKRSLRHKEWLLFWRKCLYCERPMCPPTKKRFQRKLHRPTNTTDKGPSLYTHSSMNNSQSKSIRLLWHTPYLFKRLTSNCWFLKKQIFMSSYLNDKMIYIPTV